MKKLFTLLLASIMCLSLVACSSGSGTTETTETTETEETTETTTEDVTQMTAEITWWAFPTFTTVDETFP